MTRFGLSSKSKSKSACVCVSFLSLCKLGAESKSRSKRYTRGGIQLPLSVTGLASSERLRFNLNYHQSLSYLEMQEYCHA
ncbi:hypothetical protein CMV_025578 [Castanea mollissima]|uniref:Uncharacterized protein n=1 Tax=Castanea mollissima TaxID=60419 RepID=A0A8J4QFM8_9ROSI|nr:hypothetical protein CMV_025578 [Castanea mollissima]